MLLEDLEYTVSGLQFQVNALGERLREVEHSLRNITGESPPWTVQWD